MTFSTPYPESRSESRSRALPRSPARRRGRHRLIADVVELGLMGATALRPQEFLSAGDPLEHCADVEAGFGRDARGIERGQADDILNFVADPVGVCADKIHLVEHRHNFKVMLKCQVGVAERLRRRG